MTAAPVTFRATPRPLYSPSFEQTAQYFEQGNLVPVYRALAADLETPVSVFSSSPVRTSQLCWKALSVKTVARYSLLGHRPDLHSQRESWSTARTARRAGYHAPTSTRRGCASGDQARD
ncbi:MAG: hypothetical protein U0528_11050 [Anaerolineae bacterium]